MKRDLSDAEVRVLGCLVEKERTTPDNYPLSTNALTSACNQKTSRDPVMSMTERDVDSTMLSLRERGLARSLRPTGSRAWKHRHVTTEIIPLDDGELALLAVLMLRGAQTPGELRTRTDRMVGFDSVDDVDVALRGLADREPPLVRNTGRGPGQSQDRWVHQLSVENEAANAPANVGATVSVEAAVDAPAAVGRSPHRERFRELHESFFVMPNPWDLGSARMLEDLGFPALATTSSGHARSRGKEDQELTRAELVRHVADLTGVIGVPLNVDSERLYPDEPGGVAECVRLLADAGASGCSIEDYEPRTATIDGMNEAAARVADAADACRAAGLVLTARAENHLYGIDDLDDTIERLVAYENAGADVVYAPGLATSDDISRVLDRVSRPLNVLLRPDGPSIAELEALGVTRVSVGGRLHGAAMDAVRTLAAELAPGSP